MRTLGVYKPNIRFRIRLTGNPNPGFRETLPPKKYWPATIIVGLMLAGFSIPLFTLSMDFGGSEDLFDLTFSLFHLFWGFGWSIGVLFLLALFLVLLFAREVVIVEPDNIILRYEIYPFGIETDNPLGYLSNLHYRGEEKQSAGLEWRGKHLAFDYLNVPVSFGSNLDTAAAKTLLNRINATLSHPIPAQLSPELAAKIADNKPLPELQETNFSVAEKVVPEVSQASATSTNKNTLYLLCLANLIPLGGVVILGWDIADIMILFWMESAIVGFFNILKMFRIAGPIAIFSSIFFLGHFGAFMSVHLMFVFALFIENEGGSASLAEVAQIFQALWPAILGLFISHAFSFWINFLGNKEYEKLTIGQQMQKPYTRIVLMHMTLILGGFLVLALDSRILALVLLIGMKVVADASAHIKEHRGQ